MKTARAVLTVALTVMACTSGLCDTIDEIVEKAESLNTAGDTDQAISLMRKAVTKHPDNAKLKSHLGSYYSLKSGKASEAGDMNRAAEYVERAFTALDGAIAIDPQCITALFNRGTLSINVPDFFDKLDSGIKDLEKVVDINKTSALPQEQLLTAMEFLAMGYRKKGMQDKEFETLGAIMELAPGSPHAKRADESMKTMMTSESIMKKSLDVIADEYPGIASLRKKLEENPDDLETILALALAYGAIAEQGYDDHIYNDVSYMTNIAFEVSRLLERAGELAPDNMKIILSSGKTLVMMPFFVNKLQKGITDLERVVNTADEDSLKAEAKYWLGYAHYKKAVTHWNRVVDDYPKTTGAKLTLDMLNTNHSLIQKNRPKDPCVEIDFIIGFRDELAPQTAVWIENAKGDFIKTIYVSGFSGYAKEKQVNLPKWGKSSQYADTDACTAASIDLGTHRYYWDMKDMSGNTVPAGKYKVRVETSFWPSMQYDSASVNVTVGGKRVESLSSKGKYLPALKAVYLPD